MQWQQPFHIYVAIQMDFTTLIRRYTWQNSVTQTIFINNGTYDSSKKTIIIDLYGFEARVRVPYWSHNDTLSHILPSIFCSHFVINYLPQLHSQMEISSLVGLLKPSLPHLLIICTSTIVWENGTHYHLNTFICYKKHTQQYIQNTSVNLEYCA